MRTSSEWWVITKNDPDRLKRWLTSQYRGERLASGRILALRDKFAVELEPDPNKFHRNAYNTLTNIAAQERQHAEWMRGLLATRGLDPDTLPERPERYWPKAMEAIKDLRTGCAAASHAEKMRLERIEAIVNDRTGPWDIRETFASVLPEERAHERWFREIAGADAMADTATTSALARAALGLAP